MNDRRFPYPVVSSADLAVTDPATTGGKAAQLYSLLHNEVAWPKQPIIPRGFVVTAEVFRKVVLSNDHIARLGEQIPAAGKSDELLVKHASRLERATLGIEIPESILAPVQQAASKLRGTLSIRSSATDEDVQPGIAPGVATSFLDVDPALLATTIKKVWASFFTVGFIRHRAHFGQETMDAAMAVLIHPYVRSRFVGVASSIHSRGRPVYTVSVAAGRGTEATTPTGPLPLWRVGLDLSTIVEFVPPAFPEKERSTVDERLVLKSASILAAIVKHYRENGVAEHAQIEFAVPDDGTLYLLQARPVRQRSSALGGRKSALAFDVSVDRNTTRGMQRVQLSEQSIVSEVGACIGKLQIVDDTSKDAAQGVEPGAIIVAPYTNHYWNGVFPSLGGVITVDGTETSHAAMYSRLLEKPAIVGAVGAMQALKPYDGKIVTLDTATRTVFIGCAGLCRSEHRDSIWVENASKLPPPQQKYANGLFASFRDNFERRGAGIYVEDFEGYWRRVSSDGYSNLRLDYRERSWRRMVSLLNETLGPGFKWKLPELETKRRGSALFIRFANHGSPSLWPFLTQLGPSLDPDAVLDLYDRRSRAIDDFARAVRNPTSTSLRDLIETGIDAQAWANVGFWLDQLVHVCLGFDQLKHISKGSLKTAWYAGLLCAPPASRRDLANRLEVQLLVIGRDFNSRSAAHGRAEAALALRRRLEELATEYGAPPGGLDEWEDLVLSNPETSTAPNFSQLLRLYLGHIACVDEEWPDLRSICEQDQLLAEFVRCFSQAGEEDSHSEPTDARLSDLASRLLESLESIRDVDLALRDFSTLRSAAMLDAVRSIQHEDTKLVIASAEHRLFEYLESLKSWTVDSSVPELIAWEREPSAVIPSLIQWRRTETEAAEKELEISWDLAPAVAVRKYAKVVATVVTAFGQGPTGADRHRDEIDRLLDRVARLQWLAVPGNCKRRVACRMSDIPGIRLRIAVVDDSSAVRDCLEEMLMFMGHHVCPLETESQLHSYLSTGEVDLVLLDGHLADGVDGLDVLERTHRTHPGLLVTILSADAREDRRERAHSVGAYSYLRKPKEFAEPFPIPRLLSVLDEATRRRSRRP